MERVATRPSAPRATASHMLAHDEPRAAAARPAASRAAGASATKTPSAAVAEGVEQARGPHVAAQPGAGAFVHHERVGEAARARPRPARPRRRRARARRRPAAPRPRRGRPRRPARAPRPRRAAGRRATPRSPRIGRPSQHPFLTQRLDKLGGALLRRAVQDDPAALDGAGPGAHGAPRSPSCPASPERDLDDAVALHLHDLQHRGQPRHVHLRVDAQHARRRHLDRAAHVAGVEHGLHPAVAGLETPATGAT